MLQVRVLAPLAVEQKEVVWMTSVKQTRVVVGVVVCEAAVALVVEVLDVDVEVESVEVVDWVEVGVDEESVVVVEAADSVVLVESAVVVASVLEGV